MPVVRGAAQEVAHTASRRSGPRRWLRAVAWWVTAAALHRRTGATVRAIAEDLAARMDFDRGHVRYCLHEIAARLGLDPATVKRRVAQLREAGLLAFVEHGSKTNIRRALGLKGYAGTATVYAAVIPPVYDTAHGIERVGSGYAARIVVRTVVRAVENPVGGAVEPSVDSADAPPSLAVVEEEGKLKVEGSCNNTSRERASRPTASPSTTKARTKKRSSNRGAGPRRSPAQVARDCWIAAQVRPRVNWTQRAGIRQLAFALRPMIDRGLDVHDIAAELASWMLDWRPERPAAYIRAELARQAAHEAALAARVRPQDNAEWCAWWQEAGQRETAESAVLAAALGMGGPRTDADRRAAREAGAVQLQRVVDHLEDYGPDDTLDLYGTLLASMATSMAAIGADLTTRW